MSTSEFDLSRVPEFLRTPPKTPGFETCWSFITRTEPWLFDLLADPVRDLIPDTEKADQIAEEVDSSIIFLPATMDLTREYGILCVIGYPTALLHLVFPSSP